MRSGIAADLDRFVLASAGGREGGWGESLHGAAGNGWVSTHEVLPGEGGGAANLLLAAVGFARGKVGHELTKVRQTTAAGSQ